MSGQQEQDKNKPLFGGPSLFGTAPPAPGGGLFGGAKANTLFGQPTGNQPASNQPSLFGGITPNSASSSSPNPAGSALNSSMFSNQDSKK